MTKNLITTTFPQGKIAHGDCKEILKLISNNSIDMIFADPPYFLSNGGISCKSGKIVCVDKGEWDKETDSTKITQFNSEWIRECKRILTPNGTIWITGTFHNIFDIGTLLLQQNFKILNVISWVKEDPPPNLSKRMFTHGHEFIIWAKKTPASKQTFNHEIMTKLNQGKQMTDVWILPAVQQHEKQFGYHPTQKPLCLLERIILSSTLNNQIVLDPFGGSSTTAIAAIRHKRRFIIIEKEKTYYELSLKRIKHYSIPHT